VSEETKEGLIGAVPLLVVSLARTLLEQLMQ
jgi:hypothetical protein